jgi:GT2 family glycosyltransferase
MGDAKGVLIVVPLYKAPELLAGLFGALGAMAREIEAIGGSILLLNDSPDHAGLRAELEDRLPALRATLDVELLENETNLGFVRTANRGMALALERGLDVLLLNSDTIPTPGAFAELQAVSRLDPMICAVSPRSDNATICNSPMPEHLREDGMAASLANHRFIEPMLPRFSYAPTAVGFCLYIPHLMLQEFGLFDEIYGAGYNEENDFIRRCNQCGYRAVLANHAYVHHLRSASFGQSDQSSDSHEARNRPILLGRYPEYAEICDRYFRSPDYRAQRLLAGLIPNGDGKLRLLFDCRLLGRHYNGTSELAGQLLRSFARRHGGRYDIAVLCDQGTFDLHKFDLIKGLRLVEPEELESRPFAIAFRIGQPFNLETLGTVADWAPVTGFLMLDTIALDCQQLDDQDLASLWGELADATEMIGFISEFGREQFKRRFSVSDDVVQFVSLCSTDIAEYGIEKTRGEDSAPANAKEAQPILLIGNHFPHKFVKQAVGALRDAGYSGTISVLGVEIKGKNIISYRAGELPQELVDSLYDEASVILFPSHYEGFGLPIMHALARHKPIVARDLACAREIRDRTPFGHNLHLAASTAEMVSKALERPKWHFEPMTPVHGVQRWDDAADAVARAFEEALGRFDYERCRRHQARFEGIRAQLHERGRAQQEVIRRESAAAQNIELRRTLDEDVPATIAAQLKLARRKRPWFRREEKVAIAFGRGHDSLELAHNDLLKEVIKITPGSTFECSISLPLMRQMDESLELSELARILMLDAGCWMEAVKQDEELLLAHCTRFRDWTSGLRGRMSDEQFVKACYRLAFAREPDPGSFELQLQAIKQAKDRLPVMASIFSSKERRDRLLVNYEAARTSRF